MWVDSQDPAVLPVPGDQRGDISISFGPGFPACVNSAQLAAVGVDRVGRSRGEESSVRVQDRTHLSAGNSAALALCFVRLSGTVLLVDRSDRVTDRRFKLLRRPSLRWSISLGKTLRPRSHAG